MRVAVLPGDGIGPEICAATRRVLEHADRRFALGLELEEHPIGLVALASVGTTAPNDALEACRRADGVVLGPISHADYPPADAGGINVSAKLRVGLDLYANIRPSRRLAGAGDGPQSAAFDLVIVRENTEGFYADRNMHAGSGELMPTPDVALAIRKVTAAGSRRIAEAAFELAQRRRRKVTAVHKANVLRISDGLFLGETRKVAAAHGDIAYEEQLVDSMAARLVREPGCFDVVLATNMFGDILSDLAAELAGGLGLGASINRGTKHCVAQAQHGSAPEIAGEDRANPSALIGSAAMLLDWFAQRAAGRERYADAAAAIGTALDAALADPEARTRDLGGRLGTAAFAQRVCEGLSA